ncbi:DnaJ domain protein [Aspergillus steynii IBT 23096]|uniref:DnaJ domain protein n=1 Tax=Aspergillus steynii IBT 23096 TaxID=1392250 RepID=A0A2I2G7Q2_9EURO|nr:DnaJ domain protein [Aspergillus steynii IBT 23096]PLB48901.1 DnaJ domain protein [Aspergillus steynii IBT 23096]
MVKADVRRDYYADLGLTPSAESEDVKKQFRKLALKYHPDRNPGRELEFISKFQAIQAANEILSDPQQRLRYDTDRLRAGYGKLYGPPKPSATRKTATSNFTSTPSPKPPNAKQPFGNRPQSFHSGPSSGAQRYASYARAAPKQPWEKARDEGQTRADAYRGFQEMKGNGMPGWNQFDPRTGRSAFPGATPRPAPASAGQQRPKSAYEYFKTSPKPSTPDPSRAQSARKKGFAPRAAAGGDEPMASSTSSYSNAYRGERSHTPNVFGSAPSPTARKAAAGFSSRADTLNTPEFERTSSKYAGVGGERTFFSSAGFARSSSVRDSTGSPKPYSRTNPPSPTPPESGRHRSASPKFKTDSARNYSSTSSSETDDDDFHPAHKPKAVPKSRLRPHQKFSGFHTQQPGGAANGHKSDGTASPRNVFGARAQTPFESTQAPKTNNIPHTGAFKSSSHDDLRKPFSADSWGGFDFFKPTPSDQEPAQSPVRPGSRGRAATRNSPKPGSDSAGASTHDSSRSGSTSQQQYPPFPEAKFRADDWAQKFRDMAWAMPNDDEPKTQQPAANSQRQRSPRKPNARPGAKVRSTPQPATVATEAEEAESTVSGNNKPEPAKPGSDDAEAMDLDDDLPANNTGTGANIEPEPVQDTGKENTSSKTPLASSGRGKTDSSKPESKTFNLKDLGETAPFTSTSNGGIEDLQDIHASLPFESRAKTSRTTMNDIRPRKIVCPNPPKRPQPPQLVPIGIGSERLGISRAAWDRHLAEMEAYMRQWSAFNGRMIRHFDARQEAVNTGMAPHWLGAVGDSARIKVDNENDQEDTNETQQDDDRMESGSGKGGFNAYMRALTEDREIRKHWEVAVEMHTECMIQHGQLRDALMNGSPLF